MRAWLMVGPVALVAVACGRSDLVDLLGGPSAGAGGEDAAGAGGASSSTVVVGSGTSTGVVGSSVGSANSSTGSGEMICAPLGDGCTGCIALNCPATWCQCTENEECFDLFGCFSGCEQDQDCNQACMIEHEDGISDVLLVAGCAGTTCDAMCDWGNPDFNECQECVFNDCSSELNACLADAPCQDLFQCFMQCEPFELTCQQDCYDEHGDGAEKLEELLQCNQELCEEECPP